MQMFYTNRAVFPVGHIVQPGSWGRAMARRGGLHRWFFREMMLESIRCESFPDLPDRATVAFAFDRPDAWVGERAAENIYEVELQDATTTPIVRDMAWIDRLLDVKTYEDADAIGRCYWKGEMTSKPRKELLITCPLIVVRQVRVRVAPAP